MLSHKRRLLILITSFVMPWFGANDCPAQDPIAEFQRVLREKSVFGESDLAALDHGETVIKRLPARDKRELAMCGMVRLQAPAKCFFNPFAKT